MKDFFIWLDKEAPVWVFLVFGLSLALTLIFSATLLIVFYIWASQNGYWGLFAIPPAIGIWVALREYQKSKGEKE